MSYKLKKIRYQNQDHLILLQNENGPCPLLAAANVLLLRGSITLPEHCISIGSATLDNVCNVLAEHAISCCSSSDIDFHLHELLELFPTLQDGMDINPKFTEGPTGYEYTSQMSAFDMLRIKLVHGWLVSSDSDKLLYRHTKNRTYNELLDLVIRGQEAQNEVTSTLLPKLTELETQLRNKKDTNNNNNNNDELVVTTIPIDDSDTTIENIETRIERDINEIKEQCKALSEEAERGSIVDNFLQSSSHQLTQVGLKLLLQDTKDSPKVFFRNNHFGTLTFHEGKLYLLVTDLGYGTVPEIVWEKLDNIDGNTQYVTSDFTPSKVMGHLAGGRMPDSLQSYLDSHPDPTEATDFLMALSLGEEHSNTPPTLVDDEAAQLKAATEASLKEYNHGATVAVIEDEKKQTTTPDDIKMYHYITNIVSHPRAAALQKAYSQMAQQHNDAASIALAEQLEQKEEDPSLSLAKQLQDEEYRRQTTTTAQPAEAESSLCVIS